MSVGFVQPLCTSNIGMVLNRTLQRHTGADSKKENQMQFVLALQYHLKQSPQAVGLYFKKTSNAGRNHTMSFMECNYIPQDWTLILVTR